MTLYLEPVGLLSGAAAAAALASGDAAALAGGPIAFTQLHLIERSDAAAPDRRHLTVGAVRRAAESDAVLNERFAHLTAPRSAFAGLAMDVAAPPRLMGIVNVTPDSFSDGGAHADPAAAIAHAHALVAAGADIADVGGESTRPGADPVSAEAELERVLPVIDALTAAGIRVSVDTRHASVMAAATASGTAIVNDVTALAGDPDALATVAAGDASVVLMHMAGEPRTMQAAASYADVALDVFDALAARLEACEAAGIDRARLCVDPGIGFGKTAAHNVALLHRLALFHGLGCPLLIGASRKSFVARLAGDAPVDRRLGGSLAAALAAQARGCQILRVHDVAETRQATTLAAAIAAGG
jgi:dihydropteroate synthase